MFRTKLRGTAGEYVTAFFLSAHWDLDVTIADNEGFDLLVLDPNGVLPGKKLKAISVKSRVQKDAKSLTFNIQDSYGALKREAAKWNAEPYFAFVAFHRFEKPPHIHLMVLRACEQNLSLFGNRTFKFRRAWKTKSNESFRYFVLPVEERRTREQAERQRAEVEELRKGVDP